MFSDFPRGGGRGAMAAWPLPKYATDYDKQWLNCVSAIGPKFLQYSTAKYAIAKHFGS